jgi:hypothetical protein
VAPSGGTIETKRRTCRSVQILGSSIALRAILRADPGFNRDAEQCLPNDEYSRLTARDHFESNC